MGPALVIGIGFAPGSAGNSYITMLSRSGRLEKIFSNSLVRASRFDSWARLVTFWSTEYPTASAAARTLSSTMCWIERASSQSVAPAETPTMKMTISVTLI